MPKRTDTYNVGVLYPHLVDEYDDKRNDKTIFEYTPGSKEIVYWICKEHGSYKADYYHRTKRGSGCPKCGYKHAWETKRKNIGSASFANIHPELIVDIHYTLTGLDSHSLCR